MFDMLRKGGSIFLTFFKHIPSDATLDRLAKHPEWKQYGPENFISPYYYSPNPRQKWESDLSEAGFKCYELFEDIGKYEYVDENEYDNIYQCTCTILPTIPEQEQKRFLKIYLDSTKDGKNNSVEVRNGRRILTTNYEMFIASATKI